MNFPIDCLGSACEHQSGLFKSARFPLVTWVHGCKHLASLPLTTIANKEEQLSPRFTLSLTK